jgi:hypothetical protein
MGIIDRCYNPGSSAYHHYGGRGIKVCDEWRNDFRSFLQSVGARPGDNYSIERIEVDGDYEPDNVRWARGIEQARNKRNTIWVRCDRPPLVEQVTSLAEAAERCGISYGSARAFLRRGVGFVRVERPAG